MSGRRLELFVPGDPKTKGSMVAYGRGKVRQSVVGSTRWAILMAQQARELWAGQAPMACALFGHMVFVLPGDPLRARSGDGDKLERNVWDALQPCGAKCPGNCKKHAAVIAEDVLVVHCSWWRRRCGPGDPPGVWLLVGEFDDAAG